MVWSHFLRDPIADKDIIYARHQSAEQKESPGRGVGHVPVKKPRQQHDLRDV